MKNWISPDFTITKRMLGIMLIAAGVVGLVGVFAIDVVRSSSDFGPAQQMGLLASISMLIVGISLLPLGNRSA
ncbi:MAG: hypothetical protein L0154_20350 [Chloroflexi bacterium]|nr:hypothetical protein [Chloroflexota bacterium]